MYLVRKRKSTGQRPLLEEEDTDTVKFQNPSLQSFTSGLGTTNLLLLLFLLLLLLASTKFRILRLHLQLSRYLFQPNPFQSVQCQLILTKYITVIPKPTNCYPNLIQSVQSQLISTKSIAVGQNPKLFN
jgi:hypothetical protein